VVSVPVLALVCLSSFGSTSGKYNEKEEWKAKSVRTHKVAGPKTEREGNE
jgi:hypothetical protein